MNRLEIFKIYGIPVRIDASWLVILALVTYSLAEGFFPANHPGLAKTAYWGMGFVSAVGLFLSILFHEFSHALVARHYEIKIDGITLFIFGGVAEMEDEAKSPKEEFFMAGIGPVASLVLSLLFFSLHYAISGEGGNRGLALLFYYLGFMNAILAIFNLIPAFPLDGGRVFRSILWAWRKDFTKATRTAAFFGKVFGWLLVGYGAIQAARLHLIAGFWYIVIGFYLRKASEMSLQQLEMKNVLEKAPVASLLEPRFISLSPRDPLLHLGGSLNEPIAYSNLPVVEDGRLLGYVSLYQLDRLPQEVWRQRAVADVYRRDFLELTIEPQADAWEAFRRMRRSKSGNLFVVEAGRIAGIVTLQALFRFFEAEKKPA